MVWIFFICLAILAYTYLGYPVLVWMLARCFGRQPFKEAITPSVSLLIPSYNEEIHIEAKIRNSLALDYPRDQLEIVVASDGSTDRTNALAKAASTEGIKLIAMPENIGKSAMLSKTVPQLKGEIVVFSDTSSELDGQALRLLMRNFADPSVGCVSGHYRFSTAEDLRSHGEGLYWKYETLIKQDESRLHSILGAHGAFYAIRKELFYRLHHSTINDDYLIPMRIVEQGFRAVYEPQAHAWEQETASVEGEFARRRRIAAGNCQQMVELRHMLLPRFGWVSLCFLSHKVLRTLAPLILVGLTLSSFWLPQPLLSWTIGLQVLLYGSAAVGYFFQRRGKLFRPLSPPLYFCMGNLAMLAGLARYCFSRNKSLWERAR